MRDTGVVGRRGFTFRGRKEFSSHKTKRGFSPSGKNLNFFVFSGAATVKRGCVSLRV